MDLHIKFEAITGLFEAAQKDGRDFLFEHETYELLSNSGAETPPGTIFLEKNPPYTEQEFMSIPGNRVVLKITSPAIVHKTEVGGVRIVEKNPEQILAARRSMLSDIPTDFAGWIRKNPEMTPDAYKGLSGDTLRTAISDDIRGVLVCQYMPPDSEAFGNELIVSIRYTREFGMILTAGLGGTDVELYAERFKKGQAIVSASTEMTDASTFFNLFRSTIAYQKLAGLSRGEKRVISDEQLLECFYSFIEMGRYYTAGNPRAPFIIQELEINPFSFTDYLMVPLDGICRFSSPFSLPVSRPISKINNLLHPTSIAIIGVSSTRMNFGRIIVKNIIAHGFDPSGITIIRPGLDEIDSVACVPDLRSLQKKVDLLIIAVDAGQVPDLVDEVIDCDAANSVMLIPGGLGEKKGSEDRAARLNDAIDSGRRKTGGGLIFLGGNCLGVISHPGKYDTLFIPEEKLPKQRGSHQRHAAFISQSGAFMITRTSKYPTLDPAYMISLGNQTDLTAGDIVSYIGDLEEIKIIALYMEGFNDMDGLELCRAIRRAVLARKEVIFYKAGRTPEGKSATSGHTASLAGNYMVCESCIHQAGAIVAKNFTEFDDLFLLATRLHHKEIMGNRLAAFSGAGFEAVGMADSIQGEGFCLTMAQFQPVTEKNLDGILKEKRLDGLVDIKNPMDINPAADDETHVRIAETLLRDANVDVVVMGLDPLSPATRTLSYDTIENDSPGAGATMTQLLPSVCARATKPLLGIVDGGPLYEPLIDLLDATGLPVFRSSSRAVAALAKYIYGSLHGKSIREKYDGK